MHPSATDSPRPLFAPDGTAFDTLRKRFAWNIPEHFNIGHAVCTRHARGDGRRALVCASDASATREVSFDALEADSNRLGNALRALGVKRGDRVGLVLPQRLETVLAHVAIYKLGAIALPLSRLFGRDALEYRLRDSGAVAVIADDAHIETLAALRDALPSLKHVVTCGDAAEPGGLRFDDLLGRASSELKAVATRADEPALLIYTSGTTGPPKGALNAHRCLLGNLTGFELSQNYFPADGDLMYSPADWAWTGGLLDALLPALYYGVPVLGDAAARFDPERMLSLLSHHGVRNAFVPPTALKMTMQVEAPERFPLRLRAIMSAGEQVGPEVLRFAADTLRVPVNEMWGQTESNYLAGSSSACMAVRPGSMGKPYPGHHVDVIDADGQPCADGEVGQLAVVRDDPVMFLGYWRNDAATAKNQLGPWWLTGDQGVRDGDGYLWFVGRDDDVISTAGHRVGPGEIEDCMLRHPGVAQVAVIGVPDALRGQIIKAYVVPAEGHAPDETLSRALKADVKARLAAHEYPREIAFIDALPMTTTGKVRRVALRSLHDDDGADSAR